MYSSWFDSNVKRTKIVLNSQNSGVKSRTLKYEFQFSRSQDIANKYFS